MAAERSSAGSTHILYSTPKVLSLLSLETLEASFIPKRVYDPTKALSVQSDFDSKLISALYKSVVNVLMRKQVFFITLLLYKHTPFQEITSFILKYILPMH